MSAADIVRALAAIEDPTVSTGGPVYDTGECALCDLTTGSDAWLYLDPRRDLDTGDPANHQPACPWRQAREWVAANPTSPTEDA